MYAKAVENAIAIYQLKEEKKPTDFNEIEKYINYDGTKIECAVKRLDVNGSILKKCSIEASGKENLYYTFNNGKAEKWNLDKDYKDSLNEFKNSVIKWVNDNKNIVDNYVDGLSITYGYLQDKGYVNDVVNPKNNYQPFTNDEIFVNIQKENNEYKYEVNTNKDFLLEHIDLSPIVFTFEELGVNKSSSRAIKSENQVGPSWTQSTYLYSIPIKYQDTIKIEIDNCEVIKASSTVRTLSTYDVALDDLPYSGQWSNRVVSQMYINIVENDISTYKYSLNVVKGYNYFNFTGCDYRQSDKSLGCAEGTVSYYFE